jgi:hypothetical protein
VAEPCGVETLFRPCGWCRGVKRGHDAVAVTSGHLPQHAGGGS